MVSEPYYSTHLGCRMVEKLDSDRSSVMLQILIGRSSQQLCRSQHIALDVGSGLEAAQLMRTTSRRLAHSRMAAPAPSLSTAKVRFGNIERKRVNIKVILSNCKIILMTHMMTTIAAVSREAGLGGLMSTCTATFSDRKTKCENPKKNPPLHPCMR